MPVHVRGKNVIETKTGKVVQRCKSARNAHIAAAKRNEAYKEQNYGPSRS